MSKLIYLYVKTHNITKLKYFGHTRKADPFKYRGSGIYWLRHLKKYGVDFSTEIVFSSLDEDEASREAIRLSKLWNIVESDEWANFTEENVRYTTAGFKFTNESKEKMSAALKGRIGSWIGRKHTDESKTKISAAAIGHIRWKGKKHTEESKAKMSIVHRGHRQSEETIAKRSAVWRGRKHTDETKAKISAATKGRVVSDKTRALLSAAALKGRKRNAMDITSEDVYKEGVPPELKGPLSSQSGPSFFKAV